MSAVLDVSGQDSIPNLALLVLKMILRTAARRRLLRDDPTEHVRGLREPKTDVDPLDPEAVTAFLTACLPWWRPYFTVAFWTGARPNELAALRWGDVDGVRGVLRIRLGRYRGHEGPPKTASSVRDIDCCRPLWPQSRCRRRSRPPSGSSTAAAAPSAARITCSQGRQEAS